MKKIRLTFVLLLFLFSVVGGQYILFSVYRMHVRNLAKKALREMAKDEAEILSFSRSDFRNGLPFTAVADKSDEIIYQGEFYDVKDYKVTSDSIFLFAYRDTREKQLMAQFEKNAREQDKSPASKYLHLFTHLFICIPLPPSDVIKTFAFGTFQFVVKSNNYQYLEYWIDSPPPRIV